MDEYGFQEPPDTSGDLVLSAQIECGARCGAWWTTDKAPSKTQAVRMARSRGWKLTKWDGWICPGCAKPKREKTL